MIVFSAATDRTNMLLLLGETRLLVTGRHRKMLATAL